MRQKGFFITKTLSSSKLEVTVTGVVVLLKDDVTLKSADSTIM